MKKLNIEAERGRMQMTKADMCLALGVTAKTYNGYINGSPIPSDKLERLRKITGKSVDYLLGLELPEEGRAVSWTRDHAG